MFMKIESEKLLDRKMNATVKKLGGMSIKMASNHITGLPDRQYLLPNGVSFFAEIKTTGKKPTPIQLSIHKRLRALGYRVYVIDNSKFINDLILAYHERLL